MGKVDLQTNPYTLFLIDGIGAVVSAFMLGIILPKLEHFIGMPAEILHYLAIAAALFAVYSLTCYMVRPARWTIFLRIIGMLNLTYCAVSIALVFYYFPQLTMLGLTYFIVEKIILFSLAMIELKMSYKYDRY